MRTYYRVHLHYIQSFVHLPKSGRTGGAAVATGSGLADRAGRSGKWQRATPLTLPVTTFSTHRHTHLDDALCRHTTRRPPCPGRSPRPQEALPAAAAADVARSQGGDHGRCIPPAASDHRGGRKGSHRTARSLCNGHRW